MIAGVAFDLVAQWTKKSSFADAAYYNLLVGARSTIPVIATGLLAWQLQLEGQKLKGILLLHLVLGLISAARIWLVWWINLRERQRKLRSAIFRVPIELAAVCMLGVTAHLGGFLSGVNGAR